MPRLAYLELGHVDELREIVAALHRESPLAFVIGGRQGQAALESALAVPRQPNFRTLPAKAAALHYHLNKGHPFIDGNKRFAVAAMEVFIIINGGRLMTTDEMLEKVSLDVAQDAMSRAELVEFVGKRTLRGHWRDAQQNRWLAAMQAEPVDLDVAVAFIEFVEMAGSLERWENVIARLR